MQQHAKLEFTFQFDSMILRVGVSRYCKLQYKLRPDSTNCAGIPGRPVIQDRQNHYSKDPHGEIEVRSLPLGTPLAVPSPRPES